MGSIPPVAAPRSSVVPPMSAIAAVYDRLVADHYDEDAFGIISSARAVALDQLRSLGALTAGLEICDFGVGTGECLLEIDLAHPTRAMWGVDVSERMLDHARGKLDRRGSLARTTLVQSCATRAGERVSPSSIDLAISHFLLNYVDHTALARTVATALRPGGLWSIVTSERDSFPVMATLARMFLPEAYHPDRHCFVPQSVDALRTLLELAGFEIVAQARHTCPLSFDNFDQTHRFTKHSGWFASDVVERVPEDAIRTLRGSIAQMFPLADEARVAVILCRRL